ncbi:MAG TPA: hypothetical protein VN606_19730 [Thermoleophilaceae bacterium]|nr:hypothetical protein [Thermoleophilaceae bacterium]
MPAARHIRLPLAFGATAAAIATAAVLATAGSAQTPPSSLHLVSTTQKNIGFFPKRAPRQGDRFGFGDKITGDDTGYDRAVCTVVGGKRLLCTIQVQLSKGTLSVQGLIPQKSTNEPVAITGGTGAYDGARGTALVTDVSNTQTKIDVSLLP